MIDCKITENYFAEKERLCASISECINCPLRHDNGCTNIGNKYPKRVISIVQKWSDEHPQKTYLTELLKNYPNVPHEEDGPPINLCPYDLGLTMTGACNNNCVKCWNQPLPDKERDMD